MTKICNKELYTVSQIEKRLGRSLTDKEIDELCVYNKNKDKGTSDIHREYE